MRLVFDRGTIVLLPTLPADGEDRNATALPGVLWDARIAALRCPARYHPELIAELGRRHVRFTDEVSAPPSPLPMLAPVELRPYQEAALMSWELAGRRGTAVLPTGAGKTRLAIAAIAKAGVPTLCLVPTRVLLEQWMGCLRDTLRIEPGQLGDGEHRTGAITVATFESGWRHMHRLGNQFRLLVIDEVHHFGHGMRDEALDMSIAPWRLGLTATKPTGPGADRLSELVGSPVYELRIEDLAGRFLAPFETVVLHLDLTHDERTEYQALMATFGETMRRFKRFAPNASWDDFAKAAARSDEGRRAIAAWHRARRITAFPSAKQAMVATLLDRHRASRTIVFTADNPTAYAISRANLIMPLTCDIKRKERERVLALFKEGSLRALVSAQVLNEGVDVPDAEVGIIVAGRRGEREHVQRVGRLLRPQPGKRALVYELVVRSSTEVSQSRRRRSALAA